MSARQGKRLRRRFSPPKARIFTRAPVRGSEWEWISSTASALTLIIDPSTCQAPSTARWASPLLNASRCTAGRWVWPWIIQRTSWRSIVCSTACGLTSMMASDLYWLDCWLRARMLAAIFSRQRSGSARNNFESAGCALYGGIADRPDRRCTGCRRAGSGSCGRTAPALSLPAAAACAGAGEALAEQKIAVAVDEVAGHAGLLQRFQRRGDLRVQRLGIVVADPGFKQVAEDVQRVGVNRFAL